MALSSCGFGGGFSEPRRCPCSHTAARPRLRWLCLLSPRLWGEKDREKEKGEKDRRTREEKGSGRGGVFVSMRISKIEEQWPTYANFSSSGSLAPCG